MLNSILEAINWYVLLQVVYILLLTAVSIRIIYNYSISSRASAWLFTIFVLPVFGLVLFFIFGNNKRNKKTYLAKLESDLIHLNQYRENASKHALYLKEEDKKALRKFRTLSQMIEKDGHSALTSYNQAELLINGENKYPKLYEDIEKAQNHIHIEYYIFDDDTIGQHLVEMLIKKANEGVKIRLIYDAMGSRRLDKNLVPKLLKNGIEAKPFHSISLFDISQRLNYRNHRKIVVIDGSIAYVGGINVAQNYVNDGDNQLFWRDTHLRLIGHSCSHLQYVFLADWNFCSENKIQFNADLFPDQFDMQEGEKQFVQIAHSGPDSPNPTILHSIVHAIHCAEEEILITTPYFIPDQSLIKALKVAALSGLKIKLLVPKESDSYVVNTAAQSYYAELMEIGVEIYRYTKGFVHSKTILIDDYLSIVGTANLDERSFELNFEVNALIYDSKFAQDLKENFMTDLQDAEKIDLEQWQQRHVFQQFIEKLARLISPIL